MDDFQQSDDVVDLRTYAIILWRRRWTAIITTLVVVAVAVGLTFTQTPKYDAEAELAIEPIRRSEDTSLTDLILGDSIVETERRVITSGPVTDGVIETLQLDTTRKDLLEEVTVTVVRDTRVVTIRATDESPELAAAIANTFADQYLTLRRQEALDRLLAAQDSLEQRTQLLQTELARVNGELARTPETNEEQRTSLTAERDSILTQLGQVSAQQVTTQAETDLVRGGGTILRTAEVAEFPSSPKKARTGILALVLGGMLGVGLAFGRDFLDDGVHSEEALMRAAGGAPVFGRIPTWEEQHARAVAVVAPRDHAVEAYRELRANVRFVIGQTHRDESEWEGRRRSRKPQATKRSGKSVLITSSIAGEGKSSTAANLAVVAAQGGGSVVLVDADMRRPMVENIFGIGKTSGLSHHLAEGGDVRRRLVPTGLPGLSVLPSGPTPPNPAELLSSRAMVDLLMELEATHDLVVVDSPPILAVADALELSQLCSATLLVASHQTSSQRAIRRAVERLGHIGVLVSGTVLNNIDRADSESYYGYYAPYAKGTEANEVDHTLTPRPRPRGATTPISPATSDRPEPPTPPERQERPAQPTRPAEPPIFPPSTRPGPSEEPRSAESGTSAAPSRTSTASREVDLTGRVPLGESPSARPDWAAPPANGHANTRTNDTDS